MSGHSLADALKRHKFLPGMFVQLVKIGEESNTLRRTLSDAADAYQKQQEQRLSSILNMLEPASTVVVGAIVGFIALSMFLPIYSGLGSIK
jgi:type IV pilus assembly protein PilC